MDRTADQALMKEINKYIVLNRIRFQSPISRSQISAETGLNKATVSALTDELIREGLVLEVGQGRSRVGRRPIMLLFNANAGSVMGVELGVEYVRIVITDFAARVVYAVNHPIDKRAGAADVLEFLVTCIETALVKAPVTDYGVIGIGIGVPGLVDFRRGIVLRAPHLHWDNIPLKAMLESRLHKPVFVDNEANAGALGEKLYGAATHVSNLLYVSAGTGIGTAIVVGDELMRGADGVAGEFGHMSIDAHGDPCTCGNVGCWELYASERSLCSVYAKLTGETADFDTILQRYQASDPSAMQAFQMIGRYLGIGIVNLTNGLNPAMIILGNRLAEGGRMVTDAIQQAISARCLVSPYAKVAVQASALGRDACAIGSAALVLHDFFAGPRAKTTTRSIAGK
ncbi:xylose repressor [Alicyclobacillus hesperidum subsp. aegles]|uniref:ROK family transcriptional regulator n=1 Tax=Alicyclobacillus hesperidum TaxID=89784 RepID=UPI00222DF74A|nr:ROK family transcriptional regulator [Alicyclobacillus hesperidum]GLG02674.1 xylose repressor [Alicyclobacillus hesperidum subsp. aegles]